LQFITIEGFLKRAQINLETKEISETLRPLLLNILISILKICGIATEYAKRNSVKKCILLDPLSFDDFLVLGNTWKSLSENGALKKAVGELNMFLREEDLLVGAQINRRTLETARGVERLELLMVSYEKLKGTKDNVGSVIGTKGMPIVCIPLIISKPES